MNIKEPLQSPPLISVIIPTYNRANFVLEAIESVLHQTITDFEIIVVDDGSTDDTKEKLSKYIETGTIRYLWQKNADVSAARNCGIRAAKGEYIAFLDDDDMWLPKFLETLLKEIQCHPEAGLAQSSFFKFNHENGAFLGLRDTHWFQGNIYPKILLHWGELFGPSSVMVPGRVFKEIGLFPVAITGNDLSMWCQISKVYPFCHVVEPLAKVRVHPDNFSHDRSKSSTQYLPYLQKAFLDDPDLSKRYKRLVLARMYSFCALNQLGEGTGKHIRRDAMSAISHNLFEVYAYFAVLISFLPIKMRGKLIHLYRRRKFHYE